VVAATAAKIVKRPAAFPRVIATSAEKGYGLAELRAEIAAVTIGLEAS
jgi:GTP-binding protein